jgi:hypothetical protein
MNINKAKELLEYYGYYTQNLWSIYDVQNKYDCSNEEAQKILNTALTNEATYEQIWFSIDDAAKFNNIKKIK